MQRLEIQDSDSRLVTGGYGIRRFQRFQTQILAWLREVPGYSDSSDSQFLEILDSHSSLDTGGYGMLREVTGYSDSSDSHILEILDSNSWLREVTGRSQRDSRLRFQLGYGRLREVTGYSDSRDSRLRFQSLVMGGYGIYSDSRDSRLRFQLGYGRLREVAGYSFSRFWTLNPEILKTLLRFQFQILLARKFTGYSDFTLRYTDSCLRYSARSLFVILRFQPFQPHSLRY